MYVTNTLDFEDIVSPPALVSRPHKRPPTRLAPGAHLFREGDDVERIYQVDKGVFRLTRLLPDGRRQVIAFGFPGDVIGFPYHGRYHSDCEALTPVEVTSFYMPCFDGGTCDPELRQSFFDAALHEIAAMQDHFLMLGRKSACERVASFLSVLSDRIGVPVGKYSEVTLSMSRADIADFLGLTTETVSRCFTQLRKARVIALDGAQTVIILRPEALEALAEGE